MNETTTEGSTTMDDATRKKIRSLDSSICRFRKLGRQDDVDRLLKEKEDLRAGSASRKNERVKKSLKASPKKAAPKRTKTKSPLTMPTTRPRSGARVDASAILEAIEYLGVTRPVKVVWTAGRNRTGACKFVTEWKRDEGLVQSIRITCSGLMNGEGISKVLWHELRHAAQMETYNSGHAYWNEYRKHGYNGMRYFYNPFEVEARQTAREMHDVLPLAEGDDGMVNMSAAALNPSEAGW